MFHRTIVFQRAAPILFAGVVMLFVPACRDDAEPMPAQEGAHELEPLRPPGEGSVRVAAAELRGPEGSPITGVVSFTEVEGGVRIVARVEGLEGNGPRGFHLHEIGVCQPPDFTSAGSHFDPDAHAHGGPEDSERHAGDFGNIEIGPDGTGHLDLTTDRLTLDRGPRSAVGLAVVLHEQRDDLASQPTGDAGGRVACGVVELVPAAVSDEGAD